MGGFFNNPLVNLVVDSLCALFFVSHALWDMPKAVDRKTKEPRTWMQRWRLANRDTKVFLFVGCVFAVVAATEAVDLVLHIVN